MLHYFLLCKILKALNEISAYEAQQFFKFKVLLSSGTSFANAF